MINKPLEKLMGLEDKFKESFLGTVSGGDSFDGGQFGGHEYRRDQPEVCNVILVARIASWIEPHGILGAYQHDGYSKPL